MINDRKPRQLPRIAVDNRGQVHIRPVHDRQVRDVADVDRVRPVRSEPALQQIRKPRGPFTRRRRFHPAFPGETKKAHLPHQPGGALVIETAALAPVVDGIGVDRRSHSFRAVAAVLGVEGGLDLRSQHRVIDEALPAGRGS